MKHAFAVIFFCCGLLAYEAFADRAIGTVSSSAARITHGDWERLPDGGFRFSVCGSSTLTDGGTVPQGLFTCTTCEPGAWNTAPASCVAQWRTANGL